MWSMFLRPSFNQCWLIWIIIFVNTAEVNRRLNEQEIFPYTLEIPDWATLLLTWICLFIMGWIFSKNYCAWNTARTLNYINRKIQEFINRANEFIQHLKSRRGDSIIVWREQIYNFIKDVFSQRHADDFKQCDGAGHGDDLFTDEFVIKNPEATAEKYKQYLEQFIQNVSSNEINPDFDFERHAKEKKGNKPN